MGGWQDIQLREYTGKHAKPGRRLRVIVGMTENWLFAAPSLDDLKNWEWKYGYRPDARFLDPRRDLFQRYVDASDARFTEAVTVIIDRDMQIRKVGGTYDVDHAENLDLLLELLEAPIDENP